MSYHSASMYQCKCVSYICVITFIESAYKELVKHLELMGVNTSPSTSDLLTKVLESTIKHFKKYA